MPRVSRQSASAKKTNQLDAQVLSEQERPLPEPKRSCRARGSAEAAAIPSPAPLDLPPQFAVPVHQPATQSTDAMSMCGVQSGALFGYLMAPPASAIADRTPSWNVPAPRVSAPDAAGIDVESFVNLQFQHQRALQDLLCRSEQKERFLEARCRELEQQVSQQSAAVASFERYSTGVTKLLADHSSLSLSPAISCVRMERLSPTSLLSRMPLDVLDLVVGFAQPPAIYVAGGGSTKGEPLSCFGVYRMDERQWRSTGAPMAHRRYYAAAVAHCGQVMVIGGDTTSEGAAGTNSVECYSPIRNRWTHMPSMGFSRIAHSAVALRDAVFVLGGADGDSTTPRAEFLVDKFVEAWRPNTNKWELIRSMINARRYFSCVSNFPNIYSMGGWNGKDRTQSCEMFDGFADKWIEIAPMSAGRNCASAALVGDSTIYNVGGWDGTRTLRVVERFDIREGVWKTVKSMHATRKDPAAVAMDSALVVLGGVLENEPSKTLRAAEEYDARADLWHLNHSMDLQTPLYACSAVWLASPSLTVSKRDINESASGDTASAPDNEIKRVVPLLQLRDPYDLKRAARKLTSSELVDGIIEDQCWVPANSYWKLTFAELVALGKMEVVDLERLVPHLGPTICDELWHAALTEIANSRAAWPDNDVVAWLLARCNVKTVRNYHNLLVIVLLNPTTEQPSRLIAVSLIECACDGELHFAKSHDLMQDFNRRMVGRRIFVEGKEVTRSLVSLFSLHLEYHAREDMLQLLLQHNLMIGEGTQWVVEATYKISFPLFFHEKFLTPLFVSLADAANIDRFIEGLRSMKDDTEWTNILRVHARYRQEVIDLLEKKKKAQLLVAAAAPK